MRNFGFGVIVFCLAGCSGAGGAYDEKSSASVAEPLSNHEQCDTAPFNARVVDWPGVAISPGSPSYYGSSACSGAYLVDVVGPSIKTGFVRVRWDDNLPTNATDCANARLLSYSWDRSTNAGVEDLASNGTWTGSACQIPDIFNSRFGSGVTLRYAISARQGSHLRVVALITSTPN